jgi:hypothetical protein
VATWRVKTGTIPAFALGPRKTKKNLCRDGRMYDATYHCGPRSPVLQVYDFVCGKLVWFTGGGDWSATKPVPTQRSINITKPRHTSMPPDCDWNP